MTKIGHYILEREVTRGGHVYKFRLRKNGSVICNDYDPNVWKKTASAHTFTPEKFRRASLAQLFGWENIE